MLTEASRMKTRHLRSGPISMLTADDASVLHVLKRAAEQSASESTELVYSAQTTA
jgi:hypothetical protein